MTNLVRRTLFIFLVWGAAHFEGAIASEDVRHQMDDLHPGHQSQTEYSGLKDNRVQVRFPDRLYRHTLSNMRKHLETLHKINLKLSEGDFAAASILAEKNLGMSSLHDHGAHEVGKYMPSGMAELGTQMHKSASQFAVVAQDAMVTADLAGTLKALGKVTESCVACHSSYRLVEK
jgi:hypothetical protein